MTKTASILVATVILAGLLGLVGTLAISASSEQPIRQQVSVGIRELPLTPMTKERFLDRAAKEPEASLPGLLEEARHAVNLPEGCTIKCDQGGVQALVTHEGERIPIQQQ